MTRQALTVMGGALTTAMLLPAAQPMAADFSISGESKTILRMKTTIDEKENYPLYEYLRLSLVSDAADGSRTAFHLGAWGRVDLADKTTNEYHNDDLQYAYLSHRMAKNNTVMNLGRQFISEGVATERIDGLYLRSDFAGGVGAAAFVGNSVTTDGEVIYGGRVTQGMPQYYTVGLSALKGESDKLVNYREELGIDLWLHPAKQIDLTGRSSYNSLTSGWMEHAYTVSVTPLDQLRISADLSNINYKDYFYHMSTSALITTNGIINPDETLTAAGVAVAYSPIATLPLSVDYKHYSYDIAGEADYFGGKATWTLPGTVTTGISVHRMEGDVGRLRYTETRAFATTKINHLDLTADFHNVRYDTRIDGVRNSYTILGSAGYEFSEKLKVVADGEYSKSPDFDNEMKGLLRLTYAFDTMFGEGGKKREK